MNKKSNVKRYLAALLTVIMIFQQSGVNAIFASSENIPAAATTEEEVAAQAEEAEEEPEEEEAEEPQEPTESPEPEQPEEPQDPEEPEEPEQPQETITPEATPEVTETPEETTTPTPEVTETPEETPKTNFTYEDSRVSITAEVEEGANLPQDAELKVDYLQNTDPEKYNAEIAELNNLIGVDNEKITADYLLYDIYFSSESAGGRIDATGTVKVQMQYVTPELEKNTDDEVCQSNLKVYINKKEDTTAEFEKDEADAVKRVSFKTSEMGVIALTRINKTTENKKNEQTVYTYEDGDISVTATLSSADAVPDGAEFKVTKVTSDTVGYNYEAYMQALNNADVTSNDNKADDTAKYTEKNTLLYDIAFLVNKTDEEGNTIPGEKKEYQPAEGTVNISFEFKKKQLSKELNVKDINDISIVHLPLENDIRNTVDTTADATEISADNVNVENIEEADISKNSIDFNLSDFSVVAVTVNNGKLDIQPGTSVDFRSVLGNAVYYGIVANTITKKAHMDSNFAAKTLNIGDGEENVTTGAYTQNGGVYVVASVSGNGTLSMDGKNNILWCTESGRDRFNVTGTVEIYPQATLNAYIDSMIQHVATESAAMAGYNSYDVNTIEIDGQSFQNKREIDITDCVDGTYYFDMTPYAAWGIDELKVRKNPGQTIVFNYPTSTSVTLKRFTLFNGKDDTKGISSSTNDTTVDYLCRSIIFNMPEATEVSLASATAGIFLAPKATIDKLDGTSSGWIVANSFQNNGGEWHCVYGELPEPEEIEKPVTEIFSVSKTVDGQTPAENQKFEFKLEQIGDVPEGSIKISDKIVQNNGSHVNFGTITYDTEGTYYYKISEIGKSTETTGEYTYDTQNYIVKVEVTANTSTSGNLTTTEYIKQTTYYKGNSENDCIDKNKVPGSDGITFSNTTSTPKTTKVTVTKVWFDADNQDGIRPGSVIVQLKANGNNYGDAVTLNKENEWKHTWDNLPEKTGEEIITYTVEETSVPSNYTAEITGNLTSGFIITNKHTPETVNIGGSKTWADNNNQDGKRPSKITIHLLANGSEVQSKEVTSSDNWNWNFTDLPKYASGQEITYTISEDAVSDYTSTVDGYNVTNTHIPETVNVNGSKTWNDNNDQDGKRPSKITIHLLANGSEVQSKEVTLSDNWSWNFADLPKYASGQEITYTISEDAVSDYTSTVDGYNVTNTHTPETVNVNGSKTWNDNNDQDGKRPSKITIHLLANGSEVQSKEVTSSDNWSWNFTDLPKYASGQEITYTISEDTVENYSTSYDGYDVTNTYTPGKVSVSGSKIWNDNDDQDGKRPNRIMIRLLADGKEIKSKEITALDDWKWSFTNLPEKANKKIINYTIQEDEVAEYTSNINGYNVTNTHTPETVNVSGSKTWNDNNNQDGKRPKTITIHLFANGKELTDKTKTISAADEWKWEFRDLPKYASGTEITYTVKEDTIENYSTTYDGCNVANTYTPGKISVSGNKIWNDANDNDGIRPESITINLLKNGEKINSKKVTATDEWKWSFTDLPEYENGQKIDYTITEDGVAGYTSNVSGYNVVNTHIPETTKVEGTKTWSDSNDQDGKRPSSITVNLFANGTKIVSKTVTAKDNWKYSFEDLPKYENGKAIEYTITEDAVANYSTEVKGYNITNSYTPGKTSVTVTKAWVDNDNKSGKRPSEIKVQLYVDGKESGSPVTLNEANKWTYTWSGLDEKRSGSTIVYTVKEVGTVDGYETSVSGDARTGYTITNTLKSGTLEIVKSITGAISDSTLTADQKAAMTFTVTGPDGYSQTVHYSDFTDGKYTFSNLPLGDYTVTETNADIEGYKLTTTYSVDGGKATVTSKETATVTITNDYTTTKKTSVKISKVDSGTYEVLGGAHLMVIDPDGKVVDEWDSTKKAHKITDLKPGVTYTLRETVAPKGYDVAADTTFELNEDGTFNTANTTTTISDDTLFVVDEKTVNKDINVSVTKRLVTVDGTVIGAPDATYYVALYSDPDCTQRVSDVKALNYKNASSSTVTFTGLKEGQTYYVGECETDGTSYLANINADGTMYTVDFSNGNTVEVKNSDGSTTVYFDNQFEKIPDGFYKEGELNITKKLVGGDGKAKNSSEIFYAGIFSDEDFTQLSPDVSENIVPLDLAGGSEATSQVKVSIPESGSITLYVTEVDSKGNPVAGAASFKYDVSVDNAQVTFDDNNISADVVITNTEEAPKITPTPSTPNTPNTPNTPGTPDNGTKTKVSVKTGDSTPIGMFVGLFVAAAVIAGAAVFFKRRKK